MKSTVMIAAILAFGMLSRIPALAQSAPGTKFKLPLQNGDNPGEIQSQIKSVPGVEDCAVEAGIFVIAIKAGEQVKFTEIKKALATLKPSPTIQYDAMNLEGHVILNFDHLKNPSDYQSVQKGLWNVSDVMTAELGSQGYDCTMRSPGGASLTKIAQSVALWTESGPSGSTALEAIGYIGEIFWIGSAKASTDSGTKPADPAPPAPEYKPAPPPPPAPKPAPAAAPPPPPPPPPAPQPPQPRKPNGRSGGRVPGKKP